MALPIDIPYPSLASFCQQNHIQKLALFGSVLRDDFSTQSDVDVLVEFEPNHKIGLLGFVHLELSLSDLMARTVHLNTAEDLSPYFRDNVVASAVTIYG